MKIFSINGWIKLEYRLSKSSDINSKENKMNLQLLPTNIRERMFRGLKTNQYLSIIKIKSSFNLYNVKMRVFKVVKNFIKSLSGSNSPPWPPNGPDWQMKVFKVFHGGEVRPTNPADDVILLQKQKINLFYFDQRAQAVLPSLLGHLVGHTL